VDDERSKLRELLEGLTPGAVPMRMRTPFAVDEAAWFLRAVDAGIVRFRDCPVDCFRFRKYGVAGPDHFETPARKPRHMFSKPGDEMAWLNREYVPHIGAFGSAILSGGYDQSRSSFSVYRKFSRDLITKREGQSYETDAEFYGADGSIHLQIEAKASAPQTERLAAAIIQHGELDDLPVTAVKEVEYVVDLKPRFLWVVGPDALDPPRHVFAVEVVGNNAKFSPVPGLPPPDT
jgi:hypothetical protein